MADTFPWPPLRQYGSTLGADDRTSADPAPAYLRVRAPGTPEQVGALGAPRVLMALEYLLVQAGAQPDDGGAYTLPEALLGAAAQYWACRMDALVQMPVVT